MGAWQRARDLVTVNWPVKLTALGLAAVLWAVVAAEAPTTQLLAVPVSLTPPPGRSLAGPVPPVNVLFAGAAGELLKLSATPAVIRHTIADPAGDTLVLVPLGPGDVTLPENVTARVLDLEPRRLAVRLTPPVAVAEGEGHTERVLMGVPVVVGGAGGPWVTDPPAVIVTVQGAGARLARFTRDSVTVSALATGQEPATLRLRVTAPPGILARVTPDTVVAHRRPRG